MTREERQKQLDEESVYEPFIGDGGFPLFLCGTKCNICKHYHGDDKCSCEAYPNGIPDKFAIRHGSIMPKEHSNIESDQIGEFVFSSIIN